LRFRLRQAKRENKRRNFHRLRGHEVVSRARIVSQRVALRPGCRHLGGGMSTSGNAIRRCPLSRRVRCAFETCFMQSCSFMQQISTNCNSSFPSAAPCQSNSSRPFDKSQISIRRACQNPNTCRWRINVARCAVSRRRTRSSGVVSLCRPLTARRRPNCSLAPSTFTKPTFSAPKRSWSSAFATPTCRQRRCSRSPSRPASTNSSRQAPPPNCTKRSRTNQVPRRRKTRTSTRTATPTFPKTVAQ
jgi:hypothetical protein